MASEPIWNGADLAGYLLEGVESEINIDVKGVATGSCAYSCKWANAIALAGAVTCHPDFNFLPTKSIKITREEAGMAKVTVTFEGIDPDKVDNESVPKVYSLQATVSTEPIETHPDFVEKIGGTPDAPLFNAEFDEAGKFKGFPAVLADGTTQNPKAGIKSYQCPSVVYSLEYTTNSTADALNDVGKISSPPSSAMLPSAAGRNWLFLGGTATKKGNAISVKKSWKLSGPRQWDSDIYGD
jgi:hypothetical protein